MSKAPTRSILLEGPADTSGFRTASRRLLAEGVPPERVQWCTAGGTEAESFQSGHRHTEAWPASVAEPTPAPKVPAWFGNLCETVSLHRDAGRFDLLYRLLWRLQHEPALRNEPLDADRVQADRMAAAVRRDIRKMKVFVRFRPLRDPMWPQEPVADAATRTIHVAWFEPEHHIVEATAPFFAQRFTNMRWAILTPERCARWDGRSLSFAPGADRSQAPPPDAGEQAWLAFYASTFNPARVRLPLMKKEMPPHHWKNLSEAQPISQPAADAARRSGTIAEQASSVPARDLQTQAPEGPAGSSPSGDSQAPRSGHGSNPLARLKDATDQCRECPLGEFATQSVTGDGPLRALVMFVGEQPGDQEDLQGHPFVGPAGKLFNRALAEIGVRRDQVYVSNAIKHFKFELRGKLRIHKTPAQQEIAACRHWLEDEITLVQPQALVALGATAARSLMGGAVAVMRERGHWLVRADGRKVFITVHPSSLLRMAAENQAAAYAQWVQDLRRATEPGRQLP